ncbi:MAG: GIY-YIG nuclease family protein [Pseudomonadota bacterium]
MKSLIIEEIRRIAKDSGGQAPGIRQFQKETGIGPDKWRGKIWARWSDAVAEAGCTPNTLQEGYSDEFILDQYAELCRRLNRAPTKSDIQLFARQHGQFPSYNTFVSHFGNVHRLSSVLHERSRERDELDLVALLSDFAEGGLMENSKDRDGDAEGWVYLLGSGGFYKVGRSDELEKRIKQISIALPEKAELVHAIRTDDPPGIESYWHRRFADKRANGEWFKLTSTDVKAFKRRKFQ